MDKLNQWVPRLTIAVTGIHFLAGLTVFNELGGIAADGFFDTVAEDPERESWLWFMLAGIGFLAIGLHARRAVLDSGRLPGSTAIWLLSIGLPMAVLEPASGSWALIALGLMALVASRRGSRGQPASAREEPSGRREVSE